MRFFICKTCEGEPEFAGQDRLREHLESAHPDAPTKGNRRGVMFLDGAGWYRNVFEWTLGSVELVEIDTNERSRCDRGLR